MAIEFTEKQQRVIDLRNRDLLVAAAAGSGKTAVLVERICQMVLDKEHPMDIDELLVVTFTNAAAQEMKNRVMKALQAKLREEPSNLHLQKQISLVHSAMITTIDGFCLQFLKEHFYLLDLEPGFRIVDENEKKLLMEDVMNKVLTTYYEKADERFLQFVECYTEGKTDERLGQYIAKLYEAASSFPWPRKWLQRCMGEYDEQQIKKIEDVSVMKETLLDVKKKVQDAIELMEFHVQECKSYKELDKLTDHLLGEIEKLSVLKEATTLEECYQVIGDYKFPTLPRASKLDEITASVREEAKNARDEAKDIIKGLKENYFMVSPVQSLKDHFAMKDNVNILCEMTTSFMEAFAAEKRKRNVVDFSDVEHFTLRILYNEDGTISTAGNEYANKFREIMIDEYQDSNELQEAILTELISKEKQNTMFMVGDVKQSIYRFRKADPGLFINKYNRFTYEDGKEQKIDLDKNFRSRQEVLRFSNFIFDGLMQPDLGKIQYDEHASLKYGATYNRELDELFTTRVAILDRKECELDKEQAEAIMIGKEIQNLMATGKVTEGENGYRDVKYSDIVILLRAKSMSETIVEELGKMGIPAIAIEKSGYFKTKEVATVLALLSLVDNARQDIPLAAVLQSPFVNLSKKQLAVIRSKKKEGSFYQAVYEFEEDGEIQKKLCDFQALLRDLKWKSTYMAIHELIKEIYRMTGYYEYVSLMPKGELRKMNLDILVERAKAYESTSYHGLFHFLRYIDKLKEYDVDLSEGSTLEGTNAVKLMTIHKSKGLEFPFVFVSGLGRGFNKSDSKENLIINGEYGVVLKYTDSQKRTRKETLSFLAMKNSLKNDNLAEEIRVLYVALTRAKEKLFLTAAVKDYEKALEKAVNYRNANQRLSYFGKTKAASFMDWILPIITQPMATARADFSIEVRGNLSTEEIGEVENKEENIRVLEKLNKPEGTTKGQELLERIFKEEYHHKNELDLKVKMSVSEIKHHFMEYNMSEEAKEEMEESTVSYAKPVETDNNVGALRGTATHRILECLDFAKPWAEECSIIGVEDEIQELLKKGVISAEQVELVNPQGIVDLMNSELGKTLVASAKKNLLTKEQPFVMGISPKEAGIELESNDFILVQGIIDVFMEDEDGITLLDYKTDNIKTKEELVNRYKKQMELYKEAIERAKKKRVTRVCMYSFRLKEAIDVI